MPGKRDRNTLLFSATFPDDIQRMASDFLEEYLFLSVGLVGGACKDVTQSFHQVIQNIEKLFTETELKIP